MRVTSARRGERGISTMEVLVAFGISMAAMVALYSSLRAQTSSFASQNAYAESQNVTRTLIDLMGRELRMATFDPTGAALQTTPGPACPGFKRGIVEATATRIRFSQDLNADGAINGTAEDVIYELVDGEVRRRDGNTNAVTIATGLGDDGLQLRYFDGSTLHQELVPSPALTQSQRDCVAKVLITARASIESPQAHDAGSRESLVQSEIAIRNRSLDNF